MMGITERAEDMNVNVRIEGRCITQVQKYKYLEIVVTDDGKCRT